MKRLTIIFCFLSSVISGLVGQNFSLSSDTDDREIYLFVLKEFLKQSRPNLVSNTLLIEYNLLTTSKLPKSVLGYDIKIVNLEKSLFRENKNEPSILRVVPLRFKDGEFIVSIIEYDVTYKRNNINLVNTGGKEFRFKFNCFTNTLDFLE